MFLSVRSPSNKWDLLWFILCTVSSDECGCLPRGSFYLVLVSVAGHCRTCSFDLTRAESPPKPYNSSKCLPLALCAVLLAVPQIASSLRRHLYWQVQADTRVCSAGSPVSKQDPNLGCSGLLVTLGWWKPLSCCHSWEAGRACPRDSLVQLQELCSQLQKMQSYLTVCNVVSNSYIILKKTEVNLMLFTLIPQLYV